MAKKKTAESGIKTRPETIEAKLRAANAVKLRMEGRTFPEIAQELGYNSQQAAHDAVKRALVATLREPSDALRTLELERIDVLWQMQFMNATSGDVQACMACLKLQERRAKLLGLDAPVQQEISGKDGAPLGGGTFVLPAVCTPAEWAKAAGKQQDDLTAAK
jgi:AraC-like DNA-binding protein